MECPAQSEDLKILSVWRKRKIDLEKHGHITSVTKRNEARGGHSEYLERDRREFFLLTYTNAIANCIHTVKANGNMTKY